MKKYNIYLLIMLMVTFVACEDDDTSDISFVTTYPVFELEGGPVFSVVSGGTFTDPGVTALEGDLTLDVAVSGNVDTSTPGLYTLTYSATNSDGFDGTATRQVIVTAEDVSGVDLSGNYGRTTNGTPTTIAKIASGYYSSTNLWVDGNGVSGNFIHVGGNEIMVPIQNSRFGRFQGSGTILANGNIAVTFVLLDPPNTGVALSRELEKL